MKYALAAVAVVAAVAALFIRPPQIGPGLLSLPQPPLRSESRMPEASLAHLAPARASIPSAHRVTVYVAGEVRNPGVYSVSSEGRGVDALARAGGPLGDADLVAVNLAARLSDGDEIAVPKIGAASTQRQRRAPRVRTPAKPRGRHTRRPRLEPADRQPAPIDLNSAGAADLETVPGIGPGLAARIIAYRESNGPFRSVDELADVAGITPNLQAALAEMVDIR